MSLNRLRYSSALTDELEAAIRDRRSGRYVPPMEAHRRVRNLYTWQNVAKRTHLVYDRIAQEEEVELADRLRR